MNWTCNVEPLRSTVSLCWLRCFAKSAGQALGQIVGSVCQDCLKAKYEPPKPTVVFWPREATTPHIQQGGEPTAHKTQWKRTKRDIEASITQREFQCSLADRGSNSGILGQVRLLPPIQRWHSQVLSDLILLWRDMIGITRLSSDQVWMVASV